jgi:hypothetical protein
MPQPYNTVCSEGMWVALFNYGETTQKISSELSSPLSQGYQLQHDDSNKILFSAP